jgi:ABC-2 type transport system ATP-binding protein
MISCRKLTKRFGDFTAVDSLDLEIGRGDICAVLGPNGAGKSTTVKMLSGLLTPTAGEATVAGLEVTDANRLEIKRRIGVLPENLGLFDDLTVEEHLLLTADIYGVARTIARDRMDQLLRALSLEHGRKVFASQSSHGMRKKTALAMALLPNPEVLLLDEPFEAIDPVTSRAMRDLLVKAAERGVTVLLTSHMLPVAERIANRIVIIRGGRVIWNSRSDEVPEGLEELYFRLAETPVDEKLEWLGSARS